MRYQVVGVLGRGATAVVELAVAEDGTRVARKRVGLTGSAVDIDQARRRLRREAEILAGLHHPGIVTVLAVEDDGTDVVVVMPALTGLPEWVAGSGPLPASAVREQGLRLLGALAAAHRRGIVHRDVKPANVLVDHAGRCALADFGAASSREITAGLTVAGTVIGTPRWLAPEQARGEVAGPAADVFSLGAVLAWAACGYTPWGEGPPEVLVERAARGALRPLPAGLDPALRSWLAAMLDHRPAHRPSAAGALGGLDGTVVGAVQVTADPSVRRRMGRTLLGRDGRRVARHRAGSRTRRPSRAGRTGRSAAALGVAAVVITVAVAAVATTMVAGARGGHPSRHAAAAGRASGAGSCVGRTYQPCGTGPAPHTDGTSCLPGWYDLDGSVLDGCEAHSDWVPGTAVAAGRAVRANVVPPAAVDTFTARVDGHLLSLCGGNLDVVLTAPVGTADRLEVLDGARMVAGATSADGTPATASLHKPGCVGDHSETLTLTVQTVAGQSGADFVLTRHGGW